MDCFAVPPTSLLCLLPYYHQTPSPCSLGASSVGVGVLLKAGSFAGLRGRLLALFLNFAFCSEGSLLDGGVVLHRFGFGERE